MADNEKITNSNESSEANDGIFPNLIPDDGLQIPDDKIPGFPPDNESSEANDGIFPNLIPDDGLQIPDDKIPRFPPDKSKPSGIIPDLEIE